MINNYGLVVKMFYLCLFLVLVEYCLSLDGLDALRSGIAVEVMFIFL